MIRKKPGRPRHTPAQREAAKKARNKRQVTNRRRAQWKAAGQAAEAAGTPLNVAITLTWSALRADDPAPGKSIVGLPLVTAEQRVWKALRVVAAEAGVPFLAARGPEFYGNGHHLHLAMHLPNNRAITQAINAIERLTHVEAHWRDLDGRTVDRPGARPSRGVVAMSEVRGWMIQRTLPYSGGNSVTLLNYFGKADGKDQVEGQHRLSYALAALGRAYIARAA